jgi:hypothetical protein
VANLDEYVIVYDYNGDRRFFSGRLGKKENGRSWVSEYPDAETYANEETALVAFQRVEARAELRANEAALVHRYGFEDERVVRWSQGS